MGKPKAPSYSSLVFVLVGPFADAKALSIWAHSEFRKSAAVAFVGVDSGLKPLLASGLPPTLAIGDMDGEGAADALRDASELPALVLARAKERSDLAIALDFCARQGARMIYAVGFQGGRADHDFAVHLDFSEISRRVPYVVSIGEKGAVFYLSSRFGPLRLARSSVETLRLAGVPKSRRLSRRTRATGLASVFPIGTPARGVRLRGLRFPPLDGILSLSSQGLSNEIRAREIEIGLRQGRVALFFPA
jgi:thiamine pyrophosphokinase